MVTLIDKNKVVLQASGSLIRSVLRVQNFSNNMNSQTNYEQQTIKNACASVALLNIVNNVPDLELGPNLRAFKDFSQHLSPADRGDAIANFDYIMDIHNSFARYLNCIGCRSFGWQPHL